MQQEFVILSEAKVTDAQHRALRKSGQLRFQTANWYFLNSNADHRLPEEFRVSQTQGVQHRRLKMKDQHPRKLILPIKICNVD